MSAAAVAVVGVAGILDFLAFAFPPMAFFPAPCAGSEESYFVMARKDAITVVLPGK